MPITPCKIMELVVLMMRCTHFFSLLFLCGHTWVFAIFVCATCVSLKCDWFLQLAFFFTCNSNSISCVWSPFGNISFFLNVHLWRFWSFVTLPVENKYRFRVVYLALFYRPAYCYVNKYTVCLLWLFVDNQNVISLLSSTTLISWLKNCS